MIGAIAAARRNSGGGGGGPVFRLRWDGAQFVNGGSISVSPDGLTVTMNSASNSVFTALKSALFNVTGKWKAIFDVTYTSHPYSFYLGVCDSVLDITTFANQAGNVESMYTYLSTQANIYSVSGSTLGAATPASGTLTVGFEGDTGTNDWNYRDSLGNSQAGAGGIVGHAPGPFGIFGYVQGAQVVITLRLDDGGLAGFDPDSVNVAI